MKKAWEHLISVIIGIIIVGFLAYLFIPVLSGIVTLILVVAVIGIVLVVVKKLLGQ